MVVESLILAYTYQFHWEPLLVFLWQSLTLTKPTNKTIAYLYCPERLIQGTYLAGESRRGLVASINCQMVPTHPLDESQKGRYPEGSDTNTTGT